MTKLINSKISNKDRIKILFLLLVFVVFSSIFLGILSSGENVAFAQATLFEENFNDGDISEWELFNPQGYWNVIDSELEGSAVAKGGGEQPSYAIAGDKNWQDYTYKVKIMGTQGVDKEILFRVNNANIAYILNLRSQYFGGGNDLVLAKRLPLGTEGVQALKFVPYINFPNTWYALQVNVFNTDSGVNIKAYVNCELVLEYLDQFGAISNGEIGLELWPGGYSSPIAGLRTTTRYDDIVVTTLDENPPICPSPTPTPTPFPTIGPFDLPFEYEGRGTTTAGAQFKNTFWDRLTAAFDHVFQPGEFRPFTGDTYKPSDCRRGTLGITCYDSHNGTDFSKVGGDKVLSVAGGEVIFVSEHDSEGCIPNRGGFGCVVIAQYGDVFGLYAHLDKISVEEGDKLVSSEILGQMGNTGCPSCGIHLHFGLLKKSVSPLLLGQKMSRRDWKELLYQIQPNETPRIRPFCSYTAPNGMRYTFQDPSGWKGLSPDPWSLTREEGGCNVASPYLWNYEI